MNVLSLCFLAGQRLFRRSGANSDSFSETSSVGHAEETTTVSSSTHPSTSPPAPEDDSYTTSDVIPGNVKESSEQVETEAASVEQQPESQVVEQNGR